MCKNVSDLKFVLQHIFAHSERSRIISRIKENCAYFIGISLGVSSLENDTAGSLLEQRLGLYSGDEHVTSLCEFAVQNKKRQRILLCISETCLIERDPGTYCVSSAPLVILYE